jgi:hypothetical protein
MLKIKDNVDLKDLEKFGFDKVTLLENNKTYYCHSNICVYMPSRELHIYGELAHHDCDILFDLIQAGLVEKVG